MNKTLKSVTQEHIIIVYIWIFITCIFSIIFVFLSRNFKVSKSVLLFSARDKVIIHFVSHENLLAYQVWCVGGALSMFSKYDNGTCTLKYFILPFCKQNFKFATGATLLDTIKIKRNLIEGSRLPLRPQETWERNCQFVEMNASRLVFLFFLTVWFDEKIRRDFFCTALKKWATGIKSEEVYFLTTVVLFCPTGGQKLFASMVTFFYSWSTHLLSEQKKND